MVWMMRFSRRNRVLILVVAAEGMLSLSVYCSQVAEQLRVFESKEIRGRLLGNQAYRCTFCKQAATRKKFENCLVWII
ncbi:hypothetical protein BKA64DRAFT_681079 [Cadophora sp. MPI-SDFR-AT-0126]|nr:hypothetical protein BKA64DRAFT_681079 [Leotiomycetes sp. MPI-SDFR-AT-0126]